MIDSNIEKHAKKMRSEVFKHMLKTRGQKYRAFLFYLRLFKYLSFNWSRGKFLESYYTLMRYLDDVVDGDIAIPNGYIDSVSYLSEKINFSENPNNPKDKIDFLMLHCFDLAKSFNEDFTMESNDILHSLLFDAKRRGKQIIFPEKELMFHFHSLDVKGTIRATLKVFNEDPTKYKILESLGIASRYQYDLEDFETDIKSGYINISKEECQLFEIHINDLQNINSIAIKKWLRFRAEQGLALLEEHQGKLSEGKFSLLARLALLFVYELPARKCFRKILSGKKYPTY